MSIMEFIDELLDIDCQAARRAEQQWHRAEFNRLLIESGDTPVEWEPLD